MQISFHSDLYHITHSIAEMPSGSRFIHASCQDEMMYIISGEAVCTLGEAEYRLQPYTLLLIPSDVVCDVHIMTETPLDCYSVKFAPSVLDHEQRTLLMSKLLSAADEVCCLHDLKDIGVLTLFRSFDDLDGSPEGLQKLLVPILLQALVARIQIMLSKKSTEACAPELSAQTLVKSDLLDYVNAHFTQPLTLDLLSAVFYVSKSQLNQTFRQMTGTTVIDYIIQKRIAYAQRLLGKGLSAQQAGAAAGFGDYTSFYRAYRKRMGCSPKQHQQKALPDKT